MQNHVGVHKSENKYHSTLMITVNNTRKNTGIQRQYKKEKRQCCVVSSSPAGGRFVLVQCLQLLPVK